MNQRLVKMYLLFVAVTLSVTALAKLPAVFPAPNLCMEEPMLGNWDYQFQYSNEQVLGFAASIEAVIVILICLRRWHWLPCLAAALWGSLCMYIRLFFLDPSADCGCLGWIGKPGPTTNMIAGTLALMIAAGGWISLYLLWREAHRAPPSLAVGQ